MTEGAILQLISTTGAAAVLFWVVFQFIQGRIHSDSELSALKDVVAKLETMNKTVVDQLKQTNEIFERAIEQGYAARRARRGPDDDG